MRSVLVFQKNLTSLNPVLRQIFRCSHCKAETAVTRWSPQAFQMAFDVLIRYVCFESFRFFWSHLLKKEHSCHFGPRCSKCTGDKKLRCHWIALAIFEAMF